MCSIKCKFYLIKLAKFSSYLQDGAALAVVVNSSIHLFRKKNQQLKNSAKFSSKRVVMNGKLINNLKNNLKNTCCINFLKRSNKLNNISNQQYQNHLIVNLTKINIRNLSYHLEFIDYQTIYVMQNYSKNTSQNILNSLATIRKTPVLFS